MTVLHVVDPVSYPRTRCGLKLERGVHRTGPQHVATHVTNRPDVAACGVCTTGQQVLL